MKEWLLKEEKAKVGRPKLADESIIKKAWIMIASCVLIIFVLSFNLFCDIKGVKPTKYINMLAVTKLKGSIIKDSNFEVTSKYNKDKDFVLSIKPTEKIKNTKSKYKYVLYKLSNSSWEKVDEKTYNKNTKAFSIKIKSIINKNETYKLCLYLLDSNKKLDSFEPSMWKFVDSDDLDKRYAYNIFTVKGYYSPIINEELNIKNKDNKFYISTSKSNPRQFTLSAPDITYSYKITYTDETSKKILLKEEKDTNGNKEFIIPDVNKLTNVSIKIYNDEIKKYKLKTWNTKKDFIYNTYILKPKNSYN